MHIPAGKITDAEVLEKRAADIAAHASLNGIKLVFVSLAPAMVPTHALLDVEFLNSNHLADILTTIGGGVAPHQVFALSGGVRLRAGVAVGDVRVDQVLAGTTPNRLRLRVAPIGDYSTYTLSVNFAPIDPDPVDTGIDPLFSDIAFKFRPGCFNLNCAEIERPPAHASEPTIDYLAKDFDSFKHTLITAMQQRMPDWAPTSEADLDQVLIDLIAADADELSDFQDRVMNEAYLATARKRVSVARHARLMDYHLHQGNQADAWLVLHVDAVVPLPAGFGVWTGAAWKDVGSQIFATTTARVCDPRLNDIAMYTWDDSVTALEAGATSADLALPAPFNAANAGDALIFRNLLRALNPRYLLAQQHRNPETGGETGRDPLARQLLRLNDGDVAVETVFDPMGGAAGEWCARVHWRAEDKLTQRYCFLTECVGSGVVRGISLFHGNLVPATHGRPHITVFRAPGSVLTGASPDTFVYTDESDYESTPWGVVCTLPHAPLAYLDTPLGGDTPPQSTLEVNVSGIGPSWLEPSDLVESQDQDEHFVVETDEMRVSRLRFGNGINGRAVPVGATVSCVYRIGDGIAGNVGADTLTGFDRAAQPNVLRVWNPLDVTNGRAPEPVAEAIRRAPEAYRARQLRAVTLEDYARRAEELPEVARARAHYAWTGSWRTVRIAIDPRGSTELPEPTRQKIARHLDAVRLIGEDLEVRKATYVPLDILMRLCAHADYWPEDLRHVLDLEFSDGYTADGRLGFFHPDNWTFGQPLYLSQLIGRALATQGVERVVFISIRRLHGLSGPSLTTITVDPATAAPPPGGKIDVKSFEIIQVENNPSRLESGRIAFDIRGGRQ